MGQICGVSPSHDEALFIREKGPKTIFAAAWSFRECSKRSLSHPPNPGAPSRAVSAGKAAGSVEGRGVYENTSSPSRNENAVGGLFQNSLSDSLRGLPHPAAAELAALRQSSPGFRIRLCFSATQKAINQQTLLSVGLAERNSTVLFRRFFSWFVIGSGRT